MSSMTNIFLIQALNLLRSEKDIPENVKTEAEKLLTQLEKTAGLKDVITDPRLANAITILTPFIVNWKVNQVLRLLEEIAKEQQSVPKIDPSTGLRKYI